MKNTIVFLLSFTLSIQVFSANKLDTVLRKIESKDYMVEYTSERIVGEPGEEGTQGSSKISGTIYRNGDFLVSSSKTNSYKGILVDSTCMIIDHKLKMIQLGPFEILEPVLINPMADPFSILECAKKYSSKSTVDSDLSIKKYRFIFNIDSFPISEIEFLINPDDVNHFCIRLTYFQKVKKVSEIIRYSTTSMEIPGIESQIDHYVEKRNGSYFLRKEYESYTLFNAYRIKEAIR